MRPIFAISAAEEISRGYTDEEVRQIMNKRFGRMSTEQLDLIMGQARSMVAAGLNLQHSLSELQDEREPKEQEAELQGSEVAVKVEIIKQDGGSLFRELRIDIDPDTTLEELREQIMADIDEWIAKSGESTDQTVYEVAYLIP